MNVDNIESDLNNFEANNEELINQLINLTVQTQAINRALVDSNITLMHLIDPTIDREGMIKKFAEAIATYEVEIFAFVVSRLGKK